MIGAEERRVIRPLEQGHHLVLAALVGRQAQLDVLRVEGPPLSTRRWTEQRTQPYLVLLTHLLRIRVGAAQPRVNRAGWIERRVEDAVVFQLCHREQTVAERNTKALI